MGPWNGSSYLGFALPGDETYRGVAEVRVITNSETYYYEIDLRVDSNVFRGTATALIGERPGIERVYLDPDDWTYVIDEKTNIATILKYKSTSKNSTVIVPNYIKTDDGDVRIIKVGAWSYKDGMNIWDEEICDIDKTNMYSRCPSFVTKIILCEGLKDIDSYAFIGTKNLTEVNLPDSLRSIGSCAFQECSGLTQISLPVSLKSIGYGAFQNCSGLTTINYGGNEAQWDEIEIGESNAPVINATKNFNQ